MKRTVIATPRNDSSGKKDEKSAGESPKRAKAEKNNLEKTIGKHPALRKPTAKVLPNNHLPSFTKKSIAKVAQPGSSRNTVIMHIESRNSALNKKKQ